MNEIIGTIKPIYFSQETQMWCVESFSNDGEFAGTNRSWCATQQEAQRSFDLLVAAGHAIVNPVPEEAADFETAEEFFAAIDKVEKLAFSTIADAREFYNRRVGGHWSLFTERPGGTARELLEAAQRYAAAKGVAEPNEANKRYLIQAIANGTKLGWQSVDAALRMWR